MPTDNKTAKQIFLSAHQFSEAANLLEKSISIKNYASALRIQPVIASATFALELHMKCLIMMANGQRVTGHRLTVLFGKLPSDDKDGILAFIRRAYRDPDVPTSFIADRLKLMENAFVDWRYIHEAKKLSIDMQFLRRMVWSCQQHTKTVRPKWFA